ncbi:MAG: SOS response-associated peptidase [Pseudomonadota bacterium]
MCGRFNVTSDPLSQLLLDLVGVRYNGETNLNLAPTETVQVLRIVDGAPQLVPMRWWLTPFWAKALTTKYAMFNAKSETAHKSPAFKEPFVKRRCVVPISGFYEWARSNNQKVPYYITADMAPGLLLAGLWDSWRNPETKDELLSFTVLTTVANEDLQFVHHRQPVMLSIEQARTWLDMEIPTGDLRAFFASQLPTPLQIVPVSSHVNNARNKDDRCVQPLGAATLVSSPSAGELF